MIISVYELKSNYAIVDSRVSTLQVGSGATTTVIPFDNPVPGSYVGKLFIIASGSDFGYGERVESETTGSGNVTSVTLYAPLPNAPSSGTNFVILSFGTEYENFKVDLSSFLTSMTVTTEILGGFRTCSITINADRFRSSQFYSSLKGHIVVVRDFYSRTVWEGMIIDVGVASDTVTIQAHGMYDTLNYQTYAVDWAADPSTTSTAIVKDVISDSKWIRRDYRNIDRDSAIEDAQGATATGVGPQLFSELATTGISAIEKVIKFGDYSDEMNHVYVQVWEDRIASFKAYKREVGSADVDWTIESTNLVGSSGSLSMTRSVAESYGRVSVTYTDSSGRPAQSTWKHDIDSMIEYGPREFLASSGDTPEGASIVQTALMLEDRMMDEEVGSISISGMVRVGASPDRDFAYMIRAGDVVFIQPILFDYGGINFERKSGTYFRVTGTSYSLDGNVTLTFGRGPKMLETLSEISSIDGM